MTKLVNSVDDSYSHEVPYKFNFVNEGVLIFKRDVKRVSTNKSDFEYLKLEKAIVSRCNGYYTVKLIFDVDGITHISTHSRVSNVVLPRTNDNLKYPLIKEGLYS